MAKTYTARPAGLVSIRLDVTPDQRTKLRQMAGSHNLPMSQFVRQIVLREIEKTLENPRKKGR